MGHLHCKRLMPLFVMGVDHWSWYSFSHFVPVIIGAMLMVVIGVVSAFTPNNPRRSERETEEEIQKQLESRHAELYVERQWL